jgi:ammonium transporter, Amt family
LIKGDVGQFFAQLLGVAVIIVVIGGIAYAFFSIQNKLTKGGIRSEHDDEVNGLDMPEMGVEAYVD